MNTHIKIFKNDIFKMKCRSDVLCVTHSKDVGNMLAILEKLKYNYTMNSRIFSAHTAIELFKTAYSCDFLLAYPNFVAVVDQKFHEMKDQIKELTGVDIDQYRR